LFYLTARWLPRQPVLFKSCKKQGLAGHCYHHIEMKPESIGRVLGIGLRVAGRVAGERINAASEGSPGSTRASAVHAQPRKTTTSAQASGSLMGGIGGFLRPFRRVGGTVWLEVTGVFFLLPVVVFAPTIWRTRASWLQGPDHRAFLSAAVVVVIFLYLGVTSFWRAHRRGKS
jgi:hypothetical protein